MMGELKRRHACSPLHSVLFTTEGIYFMSLLVPTGELTGNVSC